MSSSMITTTAWVRRGVAAPFPEKYEIDEAEMERISQMARTQLFNAQEGLRDAKSRSGTGNDEDDDEAMDVETQPAEAEKGGEKEDAKGEENADGKEVNIDDDDLKEYDLEHYDSDPVDSDGEATTMFGNVHSLAYHAPGEEDPYLNLPENPSDDEEREEMQILGTDNLLLAGKVEDEVAHLEVYVYEDEAENLYVHHDIMLPAIPLCLEWLDLPVGPRHGSSQADLERNTGNFVAIGTMEPDIEIWDLDVVDSMYPNAILGHGGQDAADEAAKKKKKKMKKKVNDEYHIDAILALAANRQHRNLLASGSADTTMKLWDLNTEKCAKSFNDVHTDKVCALNWHPQSATVMLSGSYDQTVVAADLRAADVKAASMRWSVASDVETVRWDPHDPNYFFVTTDSGIVYYYDVRNAASKKTSPVWTLQAHDDSVSAFDVNPRIPGFLATGSTDKFVKLWQVSPSGPSMVVSRNMEEVGKVFSVGFAPDDEVAFRLNVAGSRGVVKVWDTSTNGGVRRTFAERIGAPASTETRERIIGMANDDKDSDDDEEGGIETGGRDGWESMDED
ncbi:hypothetical protein KEM56_002400 [Ascosphaera pollenicola]|nr:hypothetical protein KEM56_002400 [Ascosphaera pollenicola]